MKQLIVVTRTTTDESENEFARFFRDGQSPVVKSEGNIVLKIFNGTTLTSSLLMQNGTDEEIMGLFEDFIESQVDEECEELTIAIHPKEFVGDNFKTISTRLNTKFAGVKVNVAEYSTGYPDIYDKVITAFQSIQEGRDCVERLWSSLCWDKRLEAKLKLLEDCLIPDKIPDKLPDELKDEQIYQAAFDEFIRVKDGPPKMTHPFDSSYIAALAMLRDTLLVG